jgi:hypothetical protein
VSPLEELKAYLPDDVTRWVDENVTLAVDEWDAADPALFGTATPPQYHDGRYWRVAVRMPLPTDQSIMGVLLHEVAHAWLQHPPAPYGTARWRRQETEAAALATKWLFPPPTP